MLPNASMSRCLIFFPLKARYDFHNYTLEGREAVHADEEPNFDLDYDPAPMPGPAVTDPPTGGTATGTDAVDDADDLPPGVHGYVEDSLGRKHPIDEFGFRIRKSTRPKGFIPEEWNKLGSETKKKILADLAKDPAMATIPAPADSWSWKAAQQCVADIQMDLDLWGARWSTGNAKWGGF